MFGKAPTRSLPSRAKPFGPGPILSHRFPPSIDSFVGNTEAPPPRHSETMQHAHPLLTELKLGLAERPSSQRFTILRKLTDLFLANAETCSDNSIHVFDDLMGRLIEQIERQALIELSKRLAPARRAPLDVIGRLSRDADVEIAGPVLELSSVLKDRDLVQIAKTRSQAHLHAIAGRTGISEPVTEILVDRGDAKVAARVSANGGARFSRWAFARAVQRAEDDEAIAVAVANRIDLPADLLDQLVRKATTVVQHRLMANARPDARQKISEVLAIVSGRVVRSAAPAGRGGRTLLKQDSAHLKARIVQCTHDRNTSGLIDALAMLAELPVQAVTRLVDAKSDETLVALGKACGIGWPDLKKTIAFLVPASVADKPDALFETYAALSPADARRAVQFIRTNTSSGMKRTR